MRTHSRRRKASYINYACDPNCEAVITKGTIWIVAIRDIQAGEELGYNHGLKVPDKDIHTKVL